MPERASDRHGPVPTRRVEPRAPKQGEMHMTYEERRTVVREPVESVRPTMVTTDGRLLDERRVARTRPSGATVLSRILVVVFGMIQLLIGLRILLLAIGARESNPIVATILNLSQPLVAPFEGILKSDALAASGAVLDVAAVLALVGWTLVELVFLAVLRVGRSGDDV